MAAIVWPLSLPQTGLLDGTQEQLGDATVRFTPDSGPAQVRRRHSVAVREITCRLHLSPVQYESLVEFYDETTESGALAWDWTHPITGATVTYRFTGPPTIIMLTPRVGASPLYQATFTLEVLPTLAGAELISSGSIFAADVTTQRPPTPEDLEDLVLAGAPPEITTSWIEPGASGSGPSGPGDGTPIDGGPGTNPGGSVSGM